jgi:hypothetical protein
MRRGRRSGESIARRKRKIAGEVCGWLRPMSARGESSAGATAVSCNGREKKHTCMFGGRRRVVKRKGKEVEGWARKVVVLLWWSGEAA